MAVTVQGALAAREEPGRALVCVIAQLGHRLVHVSAASPALQGTECDRQPLRPCEIRSESAQSPHCIAQQRTTVRNKVEEKALRPAVLWQNPWSEVCRYLLCKQGVVGSSPIVSTAEVLVRGLIFVLSRPIQLRPGHGLLAAGQTSIRTSSTAPSSSRFWMSFGLP